MTTVNAFAATSAKAVLKPFQYTLGPIGHSQVDVKVISCGICHSDVSMLDNEWGMTAFPFVGGHEIVGTVAAIGPGVKNLKVGQNVGIGWFTGSCMTCRTCMGGDHNLCASGEGTIVGRHGGFGDIVRSSAEWVLPLPDALDVKTAGPLLCGGITVFNPIVQMNVQPTDRVGVIGIGGLGHLAIKFLRAWGCEVTAFTSSPDKSAEAKILGAHDTVNSRDEAVLNKVAGRYDFVISTVNVPLQWGAYINALAPKGRLHIVGAVLEPIPVPAFPMILAQRSISGSPVGSPATLGKMLDFAARHAIEPMVEMYPMAKINNALDRLRSGKARYRVVLEA